MTDIPAPPGGQDLGPKLDAIVNALNGGFAQLESSISDALSENTEGVDKTKEEAKKSNKSLLTTAKEIPIVGKAVKLGSDQVTAAIKESMKIQKMALGRGLNLSKVVEKSNIGVMGSINNGVGATTKLNIAMEQVEAGIGTNNKATNQLAAYTKITGGNSLKLIKGIAKLGVGMGMSEDQQSKLSNSVVSLSQGFAMSTSELMNVISGMEKSMPMLKILGIAPEIAEASVRLGAALGQESGQMASDLMNSMMSAEGAIIASQLGVTAEREALLRGEGDATRNALNMVQTAGREANAMYESYLAGSGDPAIAYQAVTDALGPAMAQSAMSYRQLAQQAKESGKSMSSYMDSVANQEAISQEFTNTFGNFKDAIFSPILVVMTKLMSAFNMVTGYLLQSPLLLGIIQGFVTLGVAIASLIAAMHGLGLAMTAAKAVGGAKAGVTGLFGKAWAAMKGKDYKGPAGPKPQPRDAKGRFTKGKGGGAAEGMLKGLGTGLKSLGSGLAAVGKGFGEMLEKGFKGLAKGLTAMGKGGVLKGALAMAIIGASLIPFAYALKLMKGVGIGTLITLGVGLLFLTKATAAVGAIMMSGVGAVAIIAGAAAFAILALALIPLGVALLLSGIGFKNFSQGLSLITPGMVLSLMGLVFVLPMLSAAMIAFAAGGLIAGFIGLFSGEGPVEKIVKMGKASIHINKLAHSLKIIPGRLKKMTEAMKNISIGPFLVLAMGLAILRKSLDKFGLLDMLKLTILGGALGAGAKKATPKKVPTPKSTGLTSMGNGRVTSDAALGIKKERTWSGVSHTGVPGVLDDAPKSEIESRIAHREGPKREILARNVARAESGAGPESRMADVHRKRFDQNEAMIARLGDILESINDGTRESKNSAEEAKRQQVLDSMMNNRPTGSGVQGDID